MHRSAVDSNLMFHRPIRSKQKHQQYRYKCLIIKLHLLLFYEWENEFGWQPKRCFIVKSSRCVFSSLFVVVFIVVIFTFIEFHPKERKCIHNNFCLFTSLRWNMYMYIVFISIWIWIKLNSNDHFKLFFLFMRNKHWSRHLYDIVPSYWHFFLSFIHSPFFECKKLRSSKEKNKQIRTKCAWH